MKPSRTIGAVLFYLLSACNSSSKNEPSAIMKMPSKYDNPPSGIPTADAPVMAEPPMAIAPGRPMNIKGKEKKSSAISSVMNTASVQPDVTTNTEESQHNDPNAWVDTAKDQLSTFAIDVDTASYTMARRKLNDGTLPTPDAVRVEEFVNYFSYNYTAPTKGAFAVSMEAAPSPFTTGRVLLRVGVQGQKLEDGERKPAHLTFLVDTSGSMQSEDKLGLVKKALKMMVEHLQPGDTVALTTYAGDTRLILAPTSMDKKGDIIDAIEALTSGGGTAMSDGLKLAYEQAMKGFKTNSINRVIVLSDGDANLGPSSHEEMLKIIEGYVAEGVTLTTVGVGVGNYKDINMEQLADKGNGNYVYIDGPSAIKRFFVEQLGSSLQVIAKDVKIQVEFSKDAVARYRLIGYENRDIADADFRDDKVDAGEIGAGHSVTAIYELELSDAKTEELATVNVRAKEPEGSVAKEQSFAFAKKEVKKSFEESSSDFQFATAVVGFAEKLRKNADASAWSTTQIEDIAKKNLNKMSEREEFVQLLEQAIKLGL
jgi:Ca-activated chloride channel family protein